MTRRSRCTGLFAAGLLLAAPLAGASLDGDMGVPILDALRTVSQVFGVLGSLAMFAAGVLFYRLGRTRLLLTCLAIQTLPAVVSRTVMFAYQQDTTLLAGARIGWISGLQLLGGCVTVAQWAALGLACFLLMVGSKGVMPRAD